MRGGVLAATFRTGWRAVMAALPALGLLASALAGQDTTPPPPTRPRAESLWVREKPAPVLFSFTGAISEGAYQAGVNWALIEFIKRTRYDSAYRSRLELPEITVAAMTGASAGNINVVLGAVEYCDSSLSRAPQRSLLWRMWVESGWDDLFPADRDRGPDGGILDRSRIHARLLNALRSDMDGRSFDPRCNVPIGVVVTRVRPGQLVYDVNVTVDNQRYVGLLEARILNGRLRFVRPRDVLLGARELGAQLVLPAGSEDVIDLERVFSLVEASSAYPLAFAPVRIHYLEPDCLLNTPRPPGCTTEHTAPFMDGGVFDNKPISLAVAMSKKLDVPRERVIYVNPDAARAKLERYLEWRALHVDEDVPGGLGALLAFAGGAIPSARSYELQTFIRQQAALPDSLRAAIRSSTRAHSIVGEHLGFFAAFLGRPFREFDFYAGVSDGMQFIASEILCNEGRALASVGGRAPAGDVAARRREQELIGGCIESWTEKLAADSAFGLDSVGRFIVRRTLGREYPTIDAPRPVALGSADRARLIVLEALEQATDDKLDDRHPYECTRGSFVHRALCSDGFDRVLGALRQSPDAAAILRCTAEGRGECRSPTGAVLPEYPASVELTARLMDDADETLADLVTRAFRQLRVTERREKNDGYARVVKAIELALRSADQRVGLRYDGGPSSIPPNDGLWSRLALLPYYAGVTIGAQGGQVGWQPTVHFPWLGAVVTSPFELVRLPGDLITGQRHTTSVALSPSVGIDLPSVLVNQIVVGGRFTTQRRIDELGVRGPTWEISSYLLLRKIRATAYFIPARYTGHPHGWWIAAISAADLNGALYWILR